MARSTHITLHRWFSREDAEPWVVRSLDVTEVAVIPELWLRKIPTWCNALVYVRGHDNPMKVKESVEEVARLLRGEE